MVLLLLYCPPGALSHRSHRLHHGEAGFRRHHRWWWLVWRWPRAPSGWAGSHWIWDLIGFENVLFFFGGFNMLPHEMMIRNDDLVCPGMFYRQRTKSSNCQSMRKFMPRERRSMSQPWGASQKSKQVIQHHQKPIAVENVSRNCGGIWRTSTMPCGCWQQLLKTDLLFFKISTFHVPTYLLHSNILKMSLLLSLFWFPSTCPSTIFFLQLPFSPSSNLIPLRQPTSEIPSPKQMNMLGGRPGNLDNLMLSWGWWIHCVQTCQVNGFGWLMAIPSHTKNCMRGTHQEMF